MQLSQVEADHFFNLFKPLLVYTNQKFQRTFMSTHSSSVEEFPGRGLMQLASKN